MQGRKRQRQNIFKKGFDAIVDHFEIAGVKDDARGIAMFEHHFLGIEESH